MLDEQPKGEDGSDVALLRKTAAGDRRAFDQLVIRHRAAVFRFARAIAGSDTDAEEILQRTFIDAWRGAKSYQATGSVSSWLFAIARRASHRLHRRRAGEPAVHDELGALACDAGWGLELQPLAESIEKREWVMRALERLPVSDRELLQIVDVEGHSIAEAAVIVELTHAATKSRVHRARLKLVAALRREGNS